MRMHSHGKCTPNIILGALTVFCIFVLYNYWTISTINRDLVIKIHAMEQKIVEMSQVNEHLQASLDKVQQIREKVEDNLKKEQKVDEEAKEEITQKDNKIKSLQNDLENSKQAAQNCREELDSKSQSKDKEVSELKAKITSLEAQIEEKKSKVLKLESDMQVLQGRISSSSTPKGAGGGNKQGPLPSPDVEVGHQGDEPVLLNDPAVPYPQGWMKPQGAANLVKHVEVVGTGDNGIKRTRNMGPVIIFDRPGMPRARARFSVLDPPKTEMKPDGISPLKKPAAGAIPNPLHQEEDAREDFGQRGMPPPPGGHISEDLQNLDAAEDDKDRPIKEDIGQQDDQSPDGALSQKEVVNAIQAPNVRRDEEPRHQNL